MKDSTPPKSEKLWIDEKHRNSILKLISNDDSSGTITDILKLQKKLELSRIDSEFTDGEIIGTGEADFTKSNVPYEFISENGLPFTLLDVPGIEGHENKYEELIKQAIAKAHLVFYVNGSGKKPENKTVEKITQYLRRGASIFAICNIRGMADDYEFQSDRVTIDNKRSLEIKQQTLEELKKLLNNDCVLGTETIQGLLAFCALSVSDNGISSIHRSKCDLVRAQKGFLEYFKDYAEMRSFSKIQHISDVIYHKMDTFKEDIVESNKTKLISLIDENAEKLKTILREHKDLYSDIQKIHTISIEDINSKRKSFENNFKNKSINCLESLFAEIEEGVCEIIEKNIEDKDKIRNSSESLIHRLEKDFDSNIANIQKEAIENLFQQLDVILQDLMESIGRIKLDHKIRASIASGASLEKALDTQNFTMAVLGKSILDISSYAFAGFSLGSLFPGIGNIIGAIIGVIFGAISKVVDFFRSKNSRITKMQAKTLKSLHGWFETCSSNFTKEINNTIEDINNHIDKEVIEKLQNEITKMDDARLILESQISHFMDVRAMLKEKRYGTI